MILPRLITAIIGIPLVLLSIWFGGIPYLILIMAIVVYGIKEYQYIVQKANYDVQIVTSYIFGILMLFSVYLNGTKIGNALVNQGTALLINIMLIVVFLYEIIRCYHPKSSPKGATGRIGVTLAGVFFISWTLGHLLLIRDIRPYGCNYTYYLFLLIWSADTFAYAFGSRFGKNRLSEKVSYKKTVEGTIAGLMGGIISGIVLKIILSLKEISFSEVIFLSLGIVVIDSISDLAESLLKRDAGLKDTDMLLPGHGGILDRFDSFLFSAPIFYYYLTIFHR
ncbi:MAG: hypothetical protein COS17_06520 [Elusimicrobia bacterium CG02_land_8_20_14_3_00_37_13]|nr:MAG: hypothetical protein COS17_06520 [Elusimicrobia bacterium CG02_land_8_20_14_3_00_37_13]